MHNSICQFTKSLEEFNFDFLFLFTYFQDPLEATTGLVPLFGIDVWEHAYYLQYKNVRPDYVNAIWKIANWKDIAARFEAASS